MSRILFLLLVLLASPAFAAGTALQTKVQYVGSVEWAAVPAYPGHLTGVAAGVIVTNTDNSPAVDSERVFIQETPSTCVTGAAEPTYTTTKGAITTDTATCAWQEITGQPCVNGDTANSPVWTASTATVLGEIIYDSTSGTCQIISARTGNTQTVGNKPTFSATAGTPVTETGGAVTWTSLGAASGFGAFAAPHARILAADAATWEVATPATIYVASDHAETQGAAMTLAGGQGTAALPSQYLSVSKTTVPPTSLTAGASVSATGAFALAVGGNAYYYGITFNDASGTSTGEFITLGTNQKFTQFDTDTFDNLGTGAGGIIGAANGDEKSSVLYNSKIIFGATTQTIGNNNNAGGFYMVGGSIAASGTPPTTLMECGSSKPCTYRFRDVDISGITGTLVNAAGSSGWTGGFIKFENCKLGSGVAMTTGAFSNPNTPWFELDNSDYTSTQFRFYRSNLEGVIEDSTSVYDSTNEATDGTTPISWEIITGADAVFAIPFIVEELPVVQWYNTTGSSVTATIEIAGAQSLNNAQIWPECENLSTSGYPLGVATSGRVASPMATPATWSTSSDTWAGSPADVQYMTVSFTPQLAGTVKCRIYVADPSITEYVSPRVLLGTQGSGRQYLMPGMGYINEGAGGGTVGYAY